MVVNSHFEKPNLKVHTKFNHLKVTIICRYIFLQFSLKQALHVLIFAICTWNDTGSTFSKVW